MKKPHLFTISSQTINIIKHTIMNFEFKYKEWLEGILLDDAHGLFEKPPNEILDNLLEAGMSMPVSVLTCEGESKIFIDIRPFANALTPENNIYGRTCVSFNYEEEFKPVDQVSIDLVDPGSILEELKVCVPSATKMTAAATPEEVDTVMNTPQKTKTAVKTLLVLPPSLLERFIQDKSVTPAQKMVSLVIYLREKKITGKGKKVSKYVRALIQHFSLLHTIHGDDEREIINDTELSRASLDYTPQNKVSVRNVKENVLNKKSHNQT